MRRSSCRAAIFVATFTGAAADGSGGEAPVRARAGARSARFPAHRSTPTALPVSLERLGLPAGAIEREHSWPRSRSRNGCSVISASSSATNSALPPRALASISSSSATVRSSSSRLAWLGRERFERQVGERRPTPEHSGLPEASRHVPHRNRLGLRPSARSKRPPRRRSASGFRCPGGSYRRGRAPAPAEGAAGAVRRSCTGPPAPSAADPRPETVDEHVARTASPRRSNRIASTARCFRRGSCAGPAVLGRGEGLRAARGCGSPWQAGCST